jgi:site-specific recombinase XerC
MLPIPNHTEISITKYPINQNTKLPSRLFLAESIREFQQKNSPIKEIKAPKRKGQNPKNLSVIKLTIAINTAINGNKNL